MLNNAQNSPRKSGSGEARDASRCGARQATAPAQKNRTKRSTRRNSAASLQGSGQGAIVEIIEFADGWHARGDGGDPYLSAGETVCEIMRGRLTLDRSIQCEDQLLARSKAGQEPL